MATRKIIAGMVMLILISANAGLSKDSSEVLLKNRRFIPEPGIAASTKAKIEASPGRTHVLIQLEQTPTIKERRGLEAQGIKLLSYIPNKAWFASIPSDKADEIATISNVRAIREILPEDKISQHISAGELFEERIKDGKAVFIVEFFEDVSFAEIKEVIQRLNGLIVGRVHSLNAVVAVIPIEESVGLAFEETIKWVEQELPLEELNDGSRASIGVDIVQSPPYNLDGTNVDVLVYDTGLVDNTHGDFGGRVTLGESGDIEAHSTHVAGTVGGDGSGSETAGGFPLQWRGMAPAVDIISYSVSGPCYYLTEPPECLYDDSGQMADMENNFNEGITIYGVDIGTASVGAQPARWGISCDYEGDYCSYAKLIDTIIYNKHIPITWAAGNERGWANCGTTYNTVCPTSTGKNAIIVGSINSNDDSMTSSSSWGPTDDGRVKPDVVSPGCQVGGGITSTIPGYYIYETYCGTSMATPAVAGSVALMLEDWRNKYPGQPDSLPSTIKAILIQTAVDLGNAGPDYIYGYGKIVVNDTIDLIRHDIYGSIIEDSIIELNDKDQFTVTVPQNQPELKITLVWDDYPGEVSAASALVNDLDLIIKDPTGTRYYPWILNPSSPGDPATRGEDHINNVEQVCVANPVSGTWTIEVNGTGINSPVPEQNYSLVWSFKKAINYRIVEDFDSYDSGAAIRAVWSDYTANGSAATVNVETIIVRNGNSMWYKYENFYDPYYAESEAATTGQYKLPSNIGSNWLATGAESLSLWFFGQPGNDTGEQMYLKLTDGGTPVHTAKVFYSDYGDMLDITEEEWHEWNIPLQDFVAANPSFNLANVVKIAIGFGDGTVPAGTGTGTVFFEDIRLTYARGCLHEYATEYSAWAAWGKPDCWCYQRQCKGDSNGKKTLEKWVTAADLELLKSSFGKTDTQLKGIVYKGVSGICADLDHTATLSKRVAAPDLNIIKSYFGDATTSVPCCDQDKDCVLGPSDSVYNFWTLPPSTP